MALLPALENANVYDSQVCILARLVYECRESSKVCHNACSGSHDHKSDTGAHGETRHCQAPADVAPQWPHSGSTSQQAASKPPGWHADEEASGGRALQAPRRAPSYRRMCESLDVMSSCPASPGRNCRPVILRPLAAPWPRRFFTSARARRARGRQRGRRRGLAGKSQTCSSSSPHVIAVQQCRLCSSTPRRQEVL
jgi:hypothetical protein